MGFVKGVMRMNQWWVIILLRWINAYCIIISPYEWGMDIHKSQLFVVNKRRFRGWTLLYIWGELAIPGASLLVKQAFASHFVDQVSMWRFCQFLGTPLSAYIQYTHIRTYVRKDLVVDRIRSLADCIYIGTWLWWCFGAKLLLISLVDSITIHHHFVVSAHLFSGNSILCLAVSMLILQLFMLCILTCCQSSSEI